MKMNGTRLHYLLVLAGLLWVGVIAKGFAILEREEFTPVATSAVVASFPKDFTIPMASDKPTLILFLHPHCPCSSASLHELDRVLAETQSKLSTIIVFTIPKGEPAGWEHGDLWESAADMPGVVVLRDEEGVEARRFGVKGSGHTLLYGATGKLLFSGGITPSRGHEGDNLGSSAIVSFVLSGNALVSQTPVFGCSLL
jgi:hypothetical protein